MSEPVSAPVSICVVSNADRSREQVAVINRSSSALSLSLLGGLRFPIPGDPVAVGEVLDGQQEIVSQGKTLHLIYDATVPTSSISYRNNPVDTFKNEVVPILLARLVAGAPGAVAAVFQRHYDTCISGHHESQVDSFISASMQCLLSAAGDVVKIGGVWFLKNTLDLVVGAATGTFAKEVAARHRVGTITLQSTQVLPDVGSTPAPTPPSFYHVFGTCQDGACGLKVRSVPRYTSNEPIAVIHDGDPVAISCQDTGETVGPRPANGLSSSVWDRLLGGGWVADLYIDTPEVGTFSAGIPHC